MSDFDRDSVDEFHLQKNQVDLSEAEDSEETDSDPQEVLPIESDSDYFEKETDNADPKEWGWGKDKKNYYENKEWEEEQEEEGTEALNIQKKQLKQMQEHDFYNHTLSTWVSSDVPVDQNALNEFNQHLDSITFVLINVSFEESQCDTSKMTEKQSESLLSTHAPECLPMRDEVQFWYSELIEHVHPLYEK
jgi:hypothetical protein